MTTPADDALQEELRLAREELARLKATEDKSEKIQMTSGAVSYTHLTLPTNREV